MKERIELYPADAVARRERNNKLWTVLTAALALLLLAACIVLCATTVTATEKRNELITILISGIGGCIVIFLFKNCVYEGGRMLRHLRTLQDETPQPVRGTVTLLSGQFRIPGSILVQDVRVRTEAGEELRLHVYAGRARLLARRTEPVTLYTSHSYITAIEV